MDILMAVGHIVGALILLVVISILIAMLAAWELERNQKFAMQEASIQLAIPIDELENPAHQQKIFEYVAAKFSSELLKNRLSDFCGMLQIVWGWSGTIIQIGLFLAVIWNTFSGDLSSSIYAWFVIAVALFFWITSVSFAYACKLITGRFPNQAKQARQMLSKIPIDQFTKPSA